MNGRMEEIKFEELDNEKLAGEKSEIRGPIKE